MIDAGYQEFPLIKLAKKLKERYGGVHFRGLTVSIN